MKNIDVIWFYLEPYVFISEDKEAYFFYNTLSKKGMTICKDGMVNKVVKHLQTPVNMYSIRIGVDEMENEPLYHLIKSLQEAKFGDIIEGDLPKPIIMPPMLNHQKSVERINKFDLPIEEKILSYLHEVTIYINGECIYNCTGCRNMFKQAPFCTKSQNTLDWVTLKEFLHAISCINTSVNITGGNLFLYPELNNLLELLGEVKQITTFTVNFRNLPEDFSALSPFTNELYKLKILVNDEYQVHDVVKMVEKLKASSIEQIWETGVTSIPELEKAERLSEQLMKRNVEVNIKPFYTGENLSFFEENVFIEQEDIMAMELDRRDIFALQALNTNDFGKITILSDGTIYANINKAPVGDITKPVGDALCKELESGISWRRIRYNMEPCNQCRFKLICPSPSNYELVIGKPNLCRIK